MEQVQSLINRLSRQAAANAHAAEMLITTELLRQELVKVVDGPTLQTGEAVSVWMPNGVSRQKTTPPVYQAIHSNGFEKTNPAVQVETIQVIPAVQQVKPMVESIAMPSVPRQVYATPTEVPPAPASAPEPVAKKVAEDDSVFHLDVELTEAEIASLQQPAPEVETEIAAVLPEPEPGVNMAYRKVLADAAAAHAAMKAPSLKPFPNYPDAATVMKNVFPVAPPPVVRKEINELVADPAIPLNQKLREEKTELAEVLAAGPKLTDLRKAFGINDKYQVINSLFRGDEDMFERSVRTLNNFGSLPEARFWMQRELVVKLGWSDNDELVKNFYKLLTRRFA